MAVNLADDIFNCIFLNENDRIPIQISLKYVTRIPIDNKTDIDSGNGLGAVSIRKTVLAGMAIPMLKIRRPNGRLIFNMEIAIRR